MQVSDINEKPDQEQGQQMLTVHSVTFNAVMNTILTASNAVLSLITVPYVTRVLSVEGFGAVGFAQNVASWFSVFCLFGIPLYGVRECAKVRDDKRALAKVVKELLTLLTIFTSIFLVVFAACIVVVPQLRAQAPLMWIFLVNTLLTSYGAEWFFQAIEQYRYITIRSVVFKTITLIAILLFVKNPNDYIVYGALLALGLCGNNVLNIIRLNSMISFSGLGKLDLRQHIRPLLSFLTLNAASSVYLYLDSVILALVSPDLFQVGLYQVVTKLKAFLIGVVSAVINVLVPRLSYLIRYPSGRQYQALLAKSVHTVFNIALAICAYLFVFSDLILIFISSTKYVSATVSLQVVGVTILCSSMSVLIGYAVLTPMNRERELAISNMVGIPVSLLLNFALDRPFGALGAATAIACTELAVLGVQTYFARDVLRPVVSIKELVKIIAAVVLASVGSWGSRLLFGRIGSIPMLLAGSTVFFVIWALVLLVSRESTAMVMFDKVTRRFHFPERSK